MFAFIFLLFVCTFSLTTANNCSLDSLQNRNSVEINDILFSLYLQAFNKEYCDDNEYRRRQSNFEESLKIIRDLKKRHPNTKFGLHHMTDWSDEERKRLSGIDSDKFTEIKMKMNYTVYVPKGNAPESLDWRQYNVVTRVKDQGNCGSCYVFSAIGNIEGQYAIKHSLVALSEQQGLDCDNVDFGCEKGKVHNVYDALVRQGGAMSEADYPYWPAKGSCRTNWNKIVARVTGGQLLGIYDEEQLKDALYNIGPLSILMNFGGNTLAHYRGNIVYPHDCGRDITHALLLVGYGTEAGIPYWILKNSYSTRWGERGYLRIIRGRNACGILHYIATAIVQ